MLSIRKLGPNSVPPLLWTFMLYLSIQITAGVQLTHRDLQTTCPSGSEVLPSSRNTFTVPGYNSCNILDSHIGLVSNDYYISGIGNGDIQYFLTRIDDETLQNIWLLKDTKKWYTALSPDETKIIAAENTGNIIVAQINAETGVFEARYARDNGVRNIYYSSVVFNGGDSSTFYAVSNSIPSDTPHLLVYSVGSSSGFGFDFTQYRYIGKISHSPSLQRMLIHHSIDSAVIVSIFDLNSPYSTTNVFGYGCPTDSCVIDLENSQILVDPSNDTTGYALLEFRTDSCTYVIFSKINLSSASHDTYATDASAVDVNSLRIKDEIVYLLFFKTISSTQKNVLVIYDSSLQSPFTSTHKCLANIDENTCGSSYITTDSFTSTYGYFTQMLFSSKLTFLGSYNSKCAILQTSLNSLNRTLEFSNENTTESHLSDINTHLLNNNKPITTITNLATTSYNWGTAGTELTLRGNIANHLEDYYISDYRQLSKEIELGIEKGERKNVTLEIVCSESGGMPLKYYLESPSDAVVNEMVKIGEENGVATTDSNDYSLITRNYTAVIRIQSTSMKEDILIPFNITNFHSLNQQLKTYETIQIGFLSTLLVLSSFSLFSPNSGFNGLWMVINQQQLLILLMMIDTVIHPDVRFYITRTEFLTFSFKEFSLSSLIPQSVIPLEKLERKQSLQGLRELGFGSISAFQENFGILVALGMLLGAQIGFRLIWCIGRYCLGDWERSLRRVRQDREFSDSEDTINELYEDNDRRRREEDQSICCCLGGCMINCSIRCWKRSTKCCSKRISTWPQRYLPSRVFRNLYLRTGLESIFIILVTSLNEINNKDFSKTPYKVSYYLAWCMVISCSLFVVFLFVYFCKNKNEKIDQGATAPKIYFDTLFYELKEGNSRIYNPLLVFRKCVYVFIVFFPGIQRGQIFGIILTLQVIYFLQTIIWRKFRSGWLQLAEIFTEFFLIFFICFLMIWNDTDKWRETNSTTMKDVYTVMILVNTLIIVTIQMALLILEFREWCRKKFPTMEDETNVRNRSPSRRFEEEKNDIELRVTQRGRIARSRQSQTSSNKWKIHKNSRTLQKKGQPSQTMASFYKSQNRKKEFCKN